MRGYFFLLFRGGDLCLTSDGNLYLGTMSARLLSPEKKFGGFG